VVRGRHLSYRRRRRLVALLVVVAVAGGIATASVLLPRGQKLDRGPTSPPSAAEQAATRPPPPIHLTPADRRQIRATISLFVTTAVARHHPERAWPIVAPVLREGLTRRQWSTGNIPVVPYPAVGVDLLNVQSLAGKTALIEVILESAPSSNLVRKTFQIELRRFPRAPNGWAVSAWVPEGVSESQIERDARTTPASEVAADYRATHFSSTWIFVPLGVLLGGLIVVPAGVFLREAHRSRRAEARYRASLADQGELRR
jgi:hypothetical protein